MITVSSFIGSTGSFIHHGLEDGLKDCMGLRAIIDAFHDDGHCRRIKEDFPIWWSFVWFFVWNVKGESAQAKLNTAVRDFKYVIGTIFGVDISVLKGIKEEYPFETMLLMLCAS